MNFKIVVCALGVGLCTAGPICIPASAIAATAASDSVAALAEEFRSQGLDPAGLEPRLAKLCDGPVSLGDLADALLIAGYDVFTVVRETILACSKDGKGAEVAAQVASRVLLTQGSSVRHLIDAGVLAAASEIGRRQSGPSLAQAGGSAERAQSDDLERERLERMMRKGLIGDEYRKYIEERRRAAEAVPPPLLPSFQPGFDPFYTALFNLGLVDGGLPADALDPSVDPGASASAQ